MRVIVISGYFNPIHRGHIDYIASARNLGDFLVVIVNNDEQVKIKGSTPFMDQDERLEIVRNIKGVDRAVISIDDDGTVCQTIRQEYYRLTDDPFFTAMAFANGGDRNSDTTPEYEFCKKNNIEMLWGIGGKNKANSSSWILKKWKERN